MHFQAAGEVEEAGGALTVVQRGLPIMLTLGSAGPSRSLSLRRKGGETGARSQTSKPVAPHPTGLSTATESG